MLKHLRLKKAMQNLDLSLVLGVEFKVMFEVQVLNTSKEYTSDNVNKYTRFVRPGPVLGNDRRCGQHRSSHQAASPGSCCQMACSILRGIGLNALIVAASHGSRDYTRSKGEDRQST